MIKESIVLAGGLGTRLREAVPDLPKCMAPVAGKPFLFYVINYLRSQHIEKFIFSLGYKHEEIEKYLQTEFSTLNYECVIETEPLGTGGAIKLAATKAHTDNILVTNGDTLFKIDALALSTLHEEKHAACTLALKPMKEFDRYGMVSIDNSGLVTDFKEKQFYATGLINGGVYILNSKNFLGKHLPEKFSFEKDFLEMEMKSEAIYGVKQERYFIDIGIPADYLRAQTDLQKPPLQLSDIDKTWTLFLDRDGVINEDKPGSYIFTPDEFIFMKGSPGNFKKLSATFKYIILATNQRGVGKGLMTEATLSEIHQKMQAGISEAGGAINGIYYASDIDNNDPLRKPNPGMAIKAKEDFPDIDLNKSIMIGNNVTDMQFGRNAGLYTIFVTTTIHDLPDPHPYIDLRFHSLDEFAKAL